MKSEALYTRDEVLAYRVKWIDFLLNPKRKKAVEVLDEGKGHRCCLGHACYALGLHKTKDGSNSGFFKYNDELEVAPQQLVEMLGLYDTNGGIKPFSSISYSGGNYSSLASWNDDSEVTPQEVGAYLKTVIEGGDHTPFKPLSNYRKK